MKNKLVLTIALVVSILKLAAQDASIKWGNSISYHHKTNGFFDEVIGDNADYVYTLFDDGNQLNVKNVKIVSYSKSNANKKGEYILKGFGKQSPKEIVNAHIENVVVFEDVIYVFWRTLDSKVASYYVQSVTSDLKEKGKLKKIYEVNADIRKSGESLAFIIANPDANSRVIIGNEVKGPNDSFNVKYKILEKDLTFSDQNEITLPLEWNSKSRDFGLKSSYTFTDSGMLFISNGTKEEIAGGTARRPKYRYFNTYTIVNLTTGDAKSFPFKFEGKRLSGIRYRTFKNNGMLEGFYSDQEGDDDKSKRIDGIFHADINFDKGIIEEPVFNKFDQDFLDALYPKKGNTEDMSKRKQKKEEQKLDNELDEMVIEQIIDDNGNPILVCSQMNNYTVTTCDGKGNCTTSYYCSKSNIITFKLDNENKIDWWTITARSYTYSGWNVYDVGVSPLKEGKYMITYASALNKDELDNSSRVKKNEVKSKDERRELMEYSVLDVKAGRVEKKKMQINAPNTPTEKLKTVNPTDFYLMDGKVFVFSNNKVKKPGVMCLAYLTFCIISPFKGSGYKGEGTMGILESE